MDLNKIFKNKKLKQSKKDLQELFLSRIISYPKNIDVFKNKYVYRSLEEIIMRMSIKQIEYFLSKPPIVFISISGIYSCAIDNNQNEYLVLLFPDLIKKLSCADNSEGLAILAHELGHFFHEHSRKSISPLKAQVEADDFAFELGLGRELSEILSRFDDLNSKTRLSYLTAKILSSPTEN